MAKHKRKTKNRRTRRIYQRLIIGLTFLFSSAIILINNTTQLLQTYNFPLSSNTLNIIAWSGGIVAAVWVVILASFGEFR